MRKPGKTRVMVQVWDKIAKAIDRDFKLLHLKKAAYINDLLKVEIEALADEVTFRNADEVRQRLNERKLPDRVRVNLDLDDEVAARIDEVLRERNIPRDSFVNRVLFFLVAKDAHLRALGIDYEQASEASAKALNDALGSLRFPFHHIRQATDGKFYSLACFPDGPSGENGPNLFAMNTAISEEDWQWINVSQETWDDLGIPSVKTIREKGDETH